jgi:hypothetical protein
MTSQRTSASDAATAEPAAASNSRWRWWWMGGGDGGGVTVKSTTDLDEYSSFKCVSTSQLSAPKPDAASDTTWKPCGAIHVVAASHGGFRTDSVH